MQPDPQPAVTPAVSVPQGVVGNPVPAEPAQPKSPKPSGLAGPVVSVGRFLIAKELYDPKVRAASRALLAAIVSSIVVALQAQGLPEALGKVVGL